jgi:ABC-type oligopeptide transport system substrate-binding subunit
MAQARRLAPLCAALALAACGSSSPKPPTGGPTLRLAIAAQPRTLDPARVADLPSLNVAHELYAGLTRFSGRGVVPDLAESWEPSEGGLVWTFHLRKGIRWSDGTRIRAGDFRRAWLRALDPRTGSAYARAEMLNITGAPRYHATGSGEVGIEAPDDRTLRVTLRHPVPWLDQQVAYPVFFPLRGGAWSGPFRLAGRGADRVVLERNVHYWDVAHVAPRRIVLTTSARRVDGVLPRGTAPPGFPWIETAGAPPRGARRLSTLGVSLLWLVTKGTPLGDVDARELVENAAADLRGRLGTLVPPAMPGYSVLEPRRLELRLAPPPATFRLTLAYTTQDPRGTPVAQGLKERLAEQGVELTSKPVSSLAELVRLAGPPAQPGIDVVLLGWSAEFFDAYNILDLFPCASALNVARWCDPSYDASMRRAVRTLDDAQRYGIERDLVRKVSDEAVAIPLDNPTDWVVLKPGVHGFRWSPIGIYELMGMTRS